MDSLKNKLKLDSDLELVPDDNSLNLQQGVIGCNKYDRQYMLSFRQDGHFVDIMLSEDQLDVLRFSLLKKIK